MVNNSVIGNVISREDGLTELVNIDITDVNSLDTIEITENKAPEGYNSLIGTITLEVTKVETETGYQVLNVNFPDNVSVSLENGTIKVIVKNDKIKEF